MPFSKYLIAAVRDRLLRQGAHLVNHRESAEVVAGIRSGGQSIDHNPILIGIPKFNVPISLTNAPLTFPELPLFKRDRQTGVAKLAVELTA